MITERPPGPRVSGHPAVHRAHLVWWPVDFRSARCRGITSLLGEGEGGFGLPRRVTWRDGAGRAHLVFRGPADDHRVLPPGWDPRPVAAPVGLHRSFDPSEGAGALGWYAAGPTRHPAGRRAP